ncbi:MAG: Stk1 family PASTA domain-containing Ser/Thr kinase [Pseudobutyrivibrio sp.]|nr:Stk1 family PASTA domain-containing Ser/Thr kinase [Pseudobutyrivibrio sp.]
MITQGTFIADRYEVINKVGSGGMSDVYKAKDHILGREVAVKVLKQEFSEDATFVAKFRSEAQSAAGLEHPNIVNIYDVGSENGIYYIVMEYVEGITLKTYIEKKGQLNFKEAISIAIQVGRGIEAAHIKGIIHRDIKPQNIIISTEGKVKVTDFGIARAASSNTIHADVMGSVHYSSPEQARNGFVDGKSDIYSLGIVMYEMVTGRVPFDGDNTVAIAIQHLQEEMTPPSEYAPDLPISLEKIILKATMKSPDRRYATISDLLLDLKKSLVSPEDDFVVIADSGLEKTRVISTEEREHLAKKAAEALTFQDEYEGDYDDEPYDDEEYYDDDEEEDDKSDKIITIAGLIGGVVIVVVLVAFLGNMFGLFDLKKKVKMPDLVGMEYTEATNKLVDEGFDADNITIDYDESSKEDEGTVVQQNIAADKKVSADSVITLTVSGSDGEDEDTSDSSSNGDDTKPATDETVAVPSVEGLTQADATNALADRGLTVTGTSQEYSDEVEKGMVISQSIEAGEMVPSGSEISLVISKGPKENTYAYQVTNPFGSVDCTFKFDEINTTGVLAVHETKVLSNIPMSSLTVTYTFIPVVDGVEYPDKAEVKTEVLVGTLEE